MRITREDVLRVAELANLDLTEAEIETYGAQLGSILSYCEKLNELDTANVEPLAQVLAPPRTDETDPAEALHLRDDVARDAGIIAEVVRRAPEAVTSDPPYFRVPKVIERGE
ncbi:MAG TPA: Asp-tRNA(Asn)/Glu-tRNA(Gln) amidotransferase subunit GatC [Candidatus Acidoferrales bacterium]|nr:Asp-tRNA(Asn)/Glu-tRNA(Gln) amidotransferase subunit GatC [Candidatus Acidoferrales bacterium]